MGTLSEGLRNDALDAVFQAAPTLDYDAVWVKLHLGDPGAAGATNPAANDTRMQATFGTGAAAGAISNTVAVEWASVSDDETYTHASLWSDETVGDFLGSDELSAPAPVLIGDTFRIPIGDLDVSLT